MYVHHWCDVHRRHSFAQNNRSHGSIVSIRCRTIWFWATLSLFSLHVEPAPPLFWPYSSTIFIFLIINHQLFFQTCIILPVESAPFFIPSTSSCSLSSWFTSCTHHLVTLSSLSPSVAPSVFHSTFKTYLFHKYFPPQSAVSSELPFTELDSDRSYCVSAFLF